MKNILKDVFKKYIEYCTYAKGLRAETIRGEEHSFMAFQRITPEVVTVEDLNEERLIAFLKRLQTRERMVGKNTIKCGVKVSTIDTYWRRLNRFFNWLVIRDYLKENPIKELRGERPLYEDDKTLKKNQIEKIIASIDLHHNNQLSLKRDKAMVFSLLYLGIRKGELLGLQVRDIDFEKKTVTIRGETSKSKFTRILRLNPQLDSCLKEYIEERNKNNYKSESLWVSANQDIGLTVHGLKHWVIKLNELSGVRFHLHQFRHTFAVALAKDNVSIFNIMKLLGHKTLKMTVSYLRSIRSEDLREDISQISLDRMI